MTHLHRICPFVIAVLGAVGTLTAAPKGVAPKAQPVGMALTIGLNSVDAHHYSGWSGPLAACENDAKDMAKIAKTSGFGVKTLLTKAATRKAVIDEIKKAAKCLKTGDIFMLSYSGHGGQVADQNGDESDNLDETWCLFDGQLLDDELAALWPEFAAGVRILVFSDSCHSGTVTKFKTYQEYFRIATIAVADAQMWKKRFDALIDGSGVKNEKKPVPSPVRAMPLSVVNDTYRDNRKFYERIGQAVAGERKSNSTTQCTILLISGCQDNQLSADGPINGLFTGKLLYVWSNGRFKGSYRDFQLAIQHELPSHQSPNYFVSGAPNRAFELQTPFSR